MKSISIFFVATASYSSRLSSIINNVNSGLLGYNFTIVSAERGFSYRYNFDDSCAASWWAMLPSIYSSLRENVIYLGGLPSSLPVSISDVEDYAALPKWLHPRELSNGDLSVISKHHQALKNFLNSKDDYALICEDEECKINQEKKEKSRKRLSILLYIGVAIFIIPVIIQLVGALN